ncbi:hypothetical protein [Sulfurimonas sp. HSL3-7]|uniref:hypothetical protein n=1 Tax=Sulfonitrofixus jiaomeiensis TaxID=3131938 RepID=UPI0031F984AD
MSKIEINHQQVLQIIREQEEDIKKLQFAYEKNKEMLDNIDWKDEKGDKARDVLAKIIAELERVIGFHRKRLMHIEETMKKSQNYSNA